MAAKSDAQEQHDGGPRQPGDAPATPSGCSCGSRWRRQALAEALATAGVDAGADPTNCAATRRFEGQVSCRRSAWGALRTTSNFRRSPRRCNSTPQNRGPNPSVFHVEHPPLVAPDALESPRKGASVTVTPVQLTPGSQVGALPDMQQGANPPRSMAMATWRRLSTAAGATPRHQPIGRTSSTFEGAQPAAAAGTPGAGDAPGCGRRTAEPATKWLRHQAEPAAPAVTDSTRPRPTDHGAEGTHPTWDSRPPKLRLAPRARATESRAHVSAESPSSATLSGSEPPVIGPRAAALCDGG